MHPSIRPYLIGSAHAKKMVPANDRRGIFIGVLPFSRLPLMCAIGGLMMLAPMLMVQSGFDIYANTKGKWVSNEVLQAREQFSNLGLTLPKGMERVISHQNGITTLQLQRIGSYILPRSGDEKLELSGSLRVKISDLRQRPEPRVILQSLQALHQPVAKSSPPQEADIQEFELGKGPITRADELIVNGDIAASRTGDTPFFAVCSKPMQNQRQVPLCSGYFKQGFVFVEAEFPKPLAENWSEQIVALRRFISQLAMQGK